jgi:signal transduction histidine kinase
MQRIDTGAEAVPDASFAASDGSDARMVGAMRVVLSVAAILATAIEPSDMPGDATLAQVTTYGYFLHSIAIFVHSRLNRRFSRSKLIHWLDICWYGVFVLVTGASNSPMFLFFFFAILTSSFRWGLEEGARVAIASAVLYALCALSSTRQDDIGRLLLRTIFLLTLGYMCVYWGESKVEMRRRLALLREVSRLSNPRFGVDHTTASVLVNVLRFFGAGSCLLVVRDEGGSTCSVRTVKAGEAPKSIEAVDVSLEMAAPLIDVAEHYAVAYARSPWARLHWLESDVAYDNLKELWIRQAPAGRRLAELLEAPSFISAALPLKKGSGRIYLVSGNGTFKRADAMFLAHVAAQAIPVIESIALLDRMASDAALIERQKIALDLHDTAVQPYLGLKLALSALRNKAEAGNPLIPDLDRLIAMAAQVTDDLRRYASTVKSGWCATHPVFVEVLQLQAQQLRRFYGIDIGIRAVGPLDVSDRLAAEVVQIVREGMTNICKHTVARQGQVDIACRDGWLRVSIENEFAGHGIGQFTPRSIAERAAALGGRVFVTTSDVHGGTGVHIEIPV